MIPESEYNALLRRFHFVCGSCIALFSGKKTLSGNAVIMACEDHIDDVNDGSAHCITKDDRWRVVG